MVIDKQLSSEDQSPIVFVLDPGSGVPTYLQLVHQVEHALRLGLLKQGDRLPRVREVVAGLAINPNTVLKAYRDLESKGLASGRPGKGTFIEGSLGQIDLAGLTDLRKSLLIWLGRAQETGLDGDGLVALFSSTLRDFTERAPDGDVVEGAPGTRGRAGGGAA